jgi:branched-chain amino acid transport system ATP-binding protein
MLKLQSVMTYYGRVLALKGVSLHVEPGEIVAIVGPNGAGKTTFLSVLVGALSPAAGTVTFEGQDVTSLSAAERCRRGLVRTHQVPKPFGGMTVFENVFVAAANGIHFNRDEAYERSVDALRRSALSAVANRRAETLGLLDRKRLELARALATGPRLLLLDEIGGGLTDAEASELVEIILDLRRRGIAIVWIEHIVHLLLQVTDRLICMDAGKVIADGEPKVVMADQAVIDAYLGGGV